jgi:hypothetical protein
MLRLGKPKPHQLPNGMNLRDGNESIWLDFGEAIQHSGNAHTGIDENERNIGFAKSEDEGNEVDTVSDKEGEPHTGLHSAFKQRGSDVTGIPIQFGKRYGSVSLRAGDCVPD